MSAFYSASPLYAGLVILLPTLGRDPWRKLFRATLDELGVIGSRSTRWSSLDLDGEDEIVILYDLPAGEP